MKLQCGCEIRRALPRIQGTEDLVYLVFCGLHEAAPELLEACKDVEWVCRPVPAWNGNDGGVLIKVQLSRRTIHALRQVIKKAKGEE